MKIQTIKHLTHKQTRLHTPEIKNQNLGQILKISKLKPKQQNNKTPQYPHQTYHQ